MKELSRSTYLVQRLNKPRPGYDNPFCFGGGLRNGGLSEDAMKLLRPIFSFDYMGSAEFEFGAIPQCFQSIAKNIKQYSVHEIVINKMPVYIICKDDVKELVDETIKELAKDKIRCKGWTGFNQALGLSKYSKKEDCRTLGWLELDNEFLFFVNKEMAENTAQIFGMSYAGA